MDSEQIKQIYDTYFYYILIGGIVFGLLMGAIPLILSLRRKQTTLGFLGFVVCGICGAFSPLISIILAVIFTIIVLRKSAVDKSAVAQADLPESISHQ